ncbi:MAG: acyl-CoA/acyl-ACP dehydrogenase [Chloroflexi bacterium]|nr:acyl-CoA/acyl-ACP dehydrogenase [Chloroflexota bacterium]
MDLSLTDTQQMIRNSARDFMTEHIDSDYVRKMESHETGTDKEIWKSLAEMGWTGLLVPESDGGAGMSLIEMAVLLEEMGATALPGPFFSSAVTGATAIAEFGSDKQKQEFLPRLVDGDLVTALAFLEGSAAWDPGVVQATATRSEDGWALSGAKVFVPGGAGADVFIFAARTSQDGAPEDSLTLFLVDAKQLDSSAIKSLDSISDDRFAEVDFDGVTVPPDAILGEIDQGWPALKRILDVSTAAKCAEMLGGSRKAVDMTVEYVKERSQFGRAIGTFQAVQHRTSEMATDLEVGRQLTYKAIWKIAEGKDYEHDLATAMAYMSDRFPEICYGAHQMHGAIGFTQEHDLQIYSRRAASARVMFGDANHHRKIIAEQMGL